MEECVMTNGVLRPSMQALALAAALGLAMPTAAVALPASSPMTVAAAASGANAVTPVAWRHYYGWRHGRYGWGPGALFAGAALGIIGLGLANSYGYPYGYPNACDPYDPYDNYGYCGPYYGGPGYVYGYPGGFGHRFVHGGFGGRFAHGGVHWVHGRR
jgi:hypothetical protein